MKKSFILVCMLLLAVAIVGIAFLYPKDKKVVMSFLVEEKSISSLSEGSEGIVIGEVKKILPGQKSVDKITGETIVFTDIILSVDKSLKGIFGNKITIRLPGGTAGEGKEKLTVIVEDVPTFAMGEKVLVFLSKSNDGLFDLSDEYYTIEGWFQGKYKITSDGKANGVKGEVSLDQLESEINSALKK